MYEQDKARTELNALVSQWNDIITQLNPAGSFAAADHPTLVCVVCV